MARCFQTRAMLAMLICWCMLAASGCATFGRKQTTPPEKEGPQTVQQFLALPRVPM
jgi:hypothetical protein